ncbi:MAG: DUF3795 domain-containing protein [Lachnospiraceae bacterium]|nr:DUF3795 domain-containing protein [Lachnospiraceae bacterium]
MDKDWSEKNKEIQKILSKEASFGEAIEKLIAFREELFQQITRIVEGYPEEAFYQLPFSRHWIMHIEAMQRIKNRLCKIARKGVDPVAICGLSCNHCFLAEWCGGCRTKYNACSFATCSEGRICPNVKCCSEKNIDGCYECSELETCEKGFYVPSNDGANAARAQSIYIRKHGKKEFLKVQTRLHEKYEFQKVQEILGQVYKEAFRILEEN